MNQAAFEPTTEEPGALTATWSSWTTWGTRMGGALQQDKEGYDQDQNNKQKYVYY